MKSFLQTVFLIAVIFALALAVDQMTPLKQLTLYLNRHPDPYKTITVGMSIIGWALLICAFALGLWTKGQSMSEEAARQYMQSGAGQPRISRRFYGRAAGREFRMVVTFREINDAFRTGAWLREPHWWPIFIGLVAMPLIASGMFGHFFVVGPPLVKLICGGALVYATLRTVWGFWRA